MTEQNDTAYGRLQGHGPSSRIQWYDSLHHGRRNQEWGIVKWTEIEDSGVVKGNIDGFFANINQLPGVDESRALLHIKMPPEPEGLSQDIIGVYICIRYPNFPLGLSVVGDIWIWKKEFAWWSNLTSSGDDRLNLRPADPFDWSSPAPIRNEGTSAGTNVLKNEHRDEIISYIQTADAKIRTVVGDGGDGVGIVVPISQHAGAAGVPSGSLAIPSSAITWGDEFDLVLGFNGGSDASNSMSLGAPITTSDTFIDPDDIATSIRVETVVRSVDVDNDKWLGSPGLDDNGEALDPAIVAKFKQVSHGLLTHGMRFKPGGSPEHNSNNFSHYTYGIYDAAVQAKTGGAYGINQEWMQEHENQVRGVQLRIHKTAVDAAKTISIRIRGNLAQDPWPSPTLGVAYNPATGNGLLTTEKWRTIIEIIVESDDDIPEGVISIFPERETVVSGESRSDYVAVIPAGISGTVYYVTTDASTEVIDDEDFTETGIMDTSKQWFIRLWRDDGAPAGSEGLTNVLYRQLTGLRGSTPLASNIISVAMFAYLSASGLRPLPFKVEGVETQALDVDDECEIRVELEPLPRRFIGSSVTGLEIAFERDIFDGVFKYYSQKIDLPDPLISGDIINLFHRFSRLKTNEPDTFRPYLRLITDLGIELAWQPATQFNSTPAAFGTLTFTVSTLVRSAGSWIADGVVAGDDILIIGSGHPNNNGIHRVLGVTATTITFTAATAFEPFVNASPGSVSVLPYTNQLAITGRDFSALGGGALGSRAILSIHPRRRTRIGQELTFDGRLSIVGSADNTIDKYKFLPATQDFSTDPIPPTVGIVEIDNLLNPTLRHRYNKGQLGGTYPKPVTVRLTVTPVVGADGITTSDLIVEDNIPLQLNGKDGIFFKGSVITNVRMVSKRDQSTVPVTEGPVSGSFLIDQGPAGFEVTVTGMSSGGRLSQTMLDINALHASQRYVSIIVPERSGDGKVKIIKGTIAGTFNTTHKHENKVDWNFPFHVERVVVQDSAGKVSVTFKCGDTIEGARLGNCVDSGDVNLGVGDLVRLESITKDPSEAGFVVGSFLIGDDGVGAGEFSKTLLIDADQEFRLVAYNASTVGASTESGQSKILNPRQDTTFAIRGIVTA